MEGVNVLNIITHTVTGWSLTTAVSVLWLIGALISVIIICAAIFCRDGSICVFILFPLLFSGLIGVAMGSDSKIISTYDTYEVTIDDTVNFNKFVEYYEILDQRGQIYEVKIRDANEFNHWRLLSLIAKNKNFCYYICRK